MHTLLNKFPSSAPQNFFCRLTKLGSPIFFGLSLIFLRNRKYPFPPVNSHDTAPVLPQSMIPRFAIQVQVKNKSAITTSRHKSSLSIIFSDIHRYLKNFTNPLLSTPT